MSIDRRKFLKGTACLAQAERWRRLTSSAAISSPVQRGGNGECRRVVLADRRPFDHREIAARRHDDGDQRDQRLRRRQGHADQRRRRGRRVRSEDLQRKSLQARDPGPSADGVRILYLGEPQGGAAGVREAQQSVFLSDLLRRLRVLARTSSIPAPFPTSSSRTSFPGSSRRSARRSSSSSARTTSIRARWRRSARS